MTIKQTKNHFFSSEVRLAFLRYWSNRTNSLWKAERLASILALVEINLTMTQLLKTNPETNSIVMNKYMRLKVGREFTPSTF